MNCPFRSLPNTRTVLLPRAPCLQIGVADPLLMSSATSLSTDDSNDSGSNSDDYQ